MICQPLPNVVRDRKMDEERMKKLNVDGMDWVVSMLGEE